MRFSGEVQVQASEESVYVEIKNSDMCGSYNYAFLSLEDARNLRDQLSAVIASMEDQS